MFIVNISFTLIKQMKRKPHDHLATFHVFQGIKSPELKYTFQKSQKMFERIEKNVSFIYINTEQIKKNCWTPKDLIDWLLEGDYHIILSHIHQGMLQLCILKYNFFLTLKHTSKRFKALECLWHTSTTKQVVQSSWVSEWFTLFTFILKNIFNK